MQKRLRGSRISWRSCDATSHCCCPCESICQYCVCGRFWLLQDKCRSCLEVVAPSNAKRLGEVGMALCAKNIRVFEAEGCGISADSV